MNAATRSDRVYRTLRRRIVDGRLGPGSRLVRRAIATELGVSTIPVIEALLRLEHDGLVESTPQLGSRVRAVTEETILDDRVLREAIECQAARMSAKTASDEALEMLFARAELTDAALTSDNPTDDADDRHRDFHLTIARMTGCRSLIDQMQRVWFRRLMTLSTLTAETVALPTDWHTQLVRGIASRDPDVAEQAMRRHVRYHSDRLRDTFKRVIQRNAEPTHGAPSHDTA